jgi:hypothetical protein
MEIELIIAVLASNQLLVQTQQLMEWTELVLKGIVSKGQLVDKTTM